jgi:tetratricopeptide (TPR) repeat protein
VALAEKRPSGSAVDYFREGEEQLRRGNAELAIPAFERSLRRKPDQFWAQYFLAISYLRLQRLEEAQVSLTVAINRRPEYIWPYLLRGLTHGNLGARALTNDRLSLKARQTEADYQFQAAEADFQKVQKAIEQKADKSARYALHIDRGYVHYRQKKFKDAEADFQAAINLRSQEYLAYQNLARVQQEQKEPARWDEALKNFDEAIRLAPPQALFSLYQNRARLHLQRRALDAALLDLQKASQLGPNRETRFDLARDHIERGQLLHEEKKYPEALKALEEALRLLADEDGWRQSRPDLVIVYREQAAVLLRLGRFKEASKAVDDYLKVGPPRADVYRIRAQAQANLRNFDAAVDDYTRALGFEADAVTQYARGTAYLACDAWKLALRDFDIAVSLDPKNAEAWSLLAYGRVKQGDYRKAIETAQESLRLGQPTSLLLTNAARVFAQAADRIKKDKELSEAKSTKLRREYQDRALQLLQQGLKLLPEPQQRAFWNRYLMNNDLLPLRDRPEFFELNRKYTLPSK